MQCNMDVINHYKPGELKTAKGAVCSVLNKLPEQEAYPSDHNKKYICLMWKEKAPII